MTSFVRPQSQAWAADPMGGFGSNLTVVDKVPPHMMHLIDPYWYQFPPMNPLWHSILGFTISMLGEYEPKRKKIQIYPQFFQLKKIEVQTLKSKIL